MAAAPVPRKPAHRISHITGSQRYFSLPDGLVRNGIAAKMTRAQLILVLGVVEELTRERLDRPDCDGAVADVNTLARWSGESPKEMKRAIDTLSEAGILPAEKITRSAYRFGFAAERLLGLRERQPRYGYIAPAKPEAEPRTTEVSKRPAERSFLPASLLCPLGAECPVDRVHTRADGVLVNLPSPPAGANSGEAAPAFLSNQEVTDEKWTPVSSSGNGNGRRESEDSRTPVSVSPDVHQTKVCEEKAKMDPEKWNALRDWMAHEGTKRGRCGVRPSDAEVTRVYEELGPGTVAELQDYAAHKIHFMHRYTWLYPFARTVGRRAAAHGNGHAKAPPAVASEADLLRHEAASLLLQADPVNDDAPDYEDRQWRLAEFARKHPDVVAAVRAEMTA